MVKKNKLEENYPMAYMFFASEFPDSDLDGLSDVEIVLNYKKNCSESELAQLIIQLDKLTIEIENGAKIYEQDISEETNRTFKSSNEFLSWLSFIKVGFEST